MFALPVMLPSVTVLLETIAQTTAALVVAYTAHDWTEADRLQTTLQQLEEELAEAEADGEVEDDDDELDELNEDSESDEDAEEENEPATIEDILAGAAPGETTNCGTKQWIKQGGYAQAEEDFDNLDPANVKNIPYGKTGILGDGRKINVRSRSSDGRVTLEIQSSRGNSLIKIRYC